MSLLSALRLLRTLGKGVARGVPEATGERDPVELFGEWLTAARSSGIYLPESFCLATATSRGRPSARMVLLKDFGDDGFVFYTNYDSRKARELEENPRASMCFHWRVLQRQVRIEGDVERVSEDVSAAYFRTRPRGSQLGAWASDQSSELPGRPELKRRFSEREEEFRDREVPLPPFWGGYRLRPGRMEFWQGRADRLHDRLLFEGGVGEWTSRRLYP